jgi:hypothetical protein
MTYKQKRDEERRLIEKAKAAGIYESIHAEASRIADELSHSSSLKVFREITGGSKKRHLYVELSTGHKSALCGHEVNEHVASVQATDVRDSDCGKCAAKGKEIFSRAKSRARREDRPAL